MLAYSTISHMGIVLMGLLDSRADIRPRKFVACQLIGFMWKAGGQKKSGSPSG